MFDVSNVFPWFILFVYSNTMCTAAFSVFILFPPLNCFSPVLFFAQWKLIHCSSLILLSYLLTFMFFAILEVVSPNTLVCIVAAT